MRVKDEGHGISLQDQAHIFDRFYRVSSPVNEGKEGTGLGLAIVKAIIEKHNGQVGVESQPNRGTTFWVAFPSALSQASV